MLVNAKGSGSYGPLRTYSMESLLDLHKSKQKQHRTAGVSVLNMS